MRKLSYNRRRVIISIILIATLFTWVNYYLGTDWFGKYDKDAALASFLALMFVMVYLAPTDDEIRKHRGEKKKGKEK